MSTSSASRNVPERPRWRAVAGGVLLAGVVLACGGTAGRDARPSFVIVLSDDHRYDAVGVVQREQGGRARFPKLATPNLDRLAAEGVRFRNAFVVNALCSPSRASFLSGLYGHANGVVDNETPLDPEATTYASLLRDAGYRTGYVGKWHMGEQPERPGFDWWASYVGQGAYFDAVFRVEESRQETRGWVDDVATDFAIEFLRRHRSEPFLLVVGYKAPHGPREASSVPERARRRYDAELAAARSVGALAPYANPRERKRPPGTGRATRVYLDLVSAMDDALGRLLDEIDALGIADRTVVVFAGDNGSLLGEHGMGSKRVAYEGSIRIPLIVRWPGLGPGARGRVVDDLVLNVDLAPTLLELAGVDPPAGLQGRSLLPLLRGERVPWRTAFLYEYFAEAGSHGRMEELTPTHFALRSENAKLIVYPDHPEWTELFDLGSDPDELRNLAREPGSRAQLDELRAALEREARALGLDPSRLASSPRAAERSPRPSPRQPPGSRARSGVGDR